MKKKKLQTKRKTPKGFRAMYARTVGKKVKASAAASADELDGDVPSVGIGKALTVILILHVLAIVAIYVGTQWRGDDVPEKSNAVVVDVDNRSANETSTTNNANTGTIYPDIPASYDLDNGTRDSDAVNDRPSNDPGLTVEPRRRRPRVIKPRRNPNEPKPRPLNNPALASHTTYKIKPGDTFYRLAKRYNIKQKQLTDMNPSVDPSKMKIGMMIKVPKD